LSITFVVQFQVSFADFCVGYGTGMTVKETDGDDEPDSSSVPLQSDIVISDETYTPDELNMSPNGKLLMGLYAPDSPNCKMQ